MPKEGLIPKQSYNLFKLMLKRAPAARRAAIKAALSDGAELWLTRSKTHYLTLSPLKVRTGRLRASVTKSPVKTAGTYMSITVGTNVHYGAGWELGFSRGGKMFAPRKWLEPAGEDVKPNIRRLLERVGVSF